MNALSLINSLKTKIENEFLRCRHFLWRLGGGLFVLWLAGVGVGCRSATPVRYHSSNLRAHRFAPPRLHRVEHTRQSLVRGARQQIGRRWVRCSRRYTLRGGCPGWVRCLYSRLGGDLFRPPGRRLGYGVLLIYRDICA